jgi:hypothetical protein
MALNYSNLPLVKPFLEPTKPKDPVRVSFFIYQKIRRHCCSEKDDAIPFFLITIKNLKHYLSLQSTASAFPLKQSEKSK